MHPAERGGTTPCQTSRNGAYASEEFRPMAFPIPSLCLDRQTTTSPACIIVRGQKLERPSER